jgi:hypothetical protein
MLSNQEAGLMQQSLDTNQQLPLASAPSWAWHSDRPISDEDEDRDGPWNVGFFAA